MADTQKSKSYMTPILVVLLVVASFAIGIMWQKIQNLETTDVAQQPTNEIPPELLGEAAPPEEPTLADIAPVTDADHIRGDINAPIILIEYSDFECPFCSRVHPSIQQLVDENSDVAWVFRHFPLTQIHPTAERLSIAAECVAELEGNDAFWDYNDTLFESQSPGLDPVALAVAQGVNKAAFEACLEDEVMAARVQEDYDSGVAAGVQGTPHNVLITKDGQLEILRGALPYEQMAAAVESLR